MSYIDRIPAKARGIIYSTLATVFGVEWALDVVGWGVIPEDVQTKALTVLAALGFVLAKRNTTDITVVAA